MKHGLWLLLLLFPACTPKLTDLHNEKNDTTFLVAGKVMVTEGYCGGMPPEPGVMEELQTPHPRPHLELLVRRGDKNIFGAGIVARCTTDAQGQFTMRLPRGEYCLVLAEKESGRPREMYKDECLHIDRGCDTQWLHRCDLSIRVEDTAVTALSMLLHEKCFISSFSPCITWTGPLVP